MAAPVVPAAWHSSLISQISHCRPPCDGAAGCPGGLAAQPRAVGAALHHQPPALAARQLPRVSHQPLAPQLRALSWHAQRCCRRCCCRLHCLRFQSRPAAPWAMAARRSAHALRPSAAWRHPRSVPSASGPQVPAVGCSAPGLLTGGNVRPWGGGRPSTDPNPGGRVRGTGEGSGDEGMGTLELSEVGWYKQA